MISLLDDPDPYVFEVIRKHILQMGRQVLGHLQALRYTSESQLAVERAELLISEIKFKDTKKALHRWAVAAQHDIIDFIDIIDGWLSREQVRTLARCRIRRLANAVWLDIDELLSAREKFSNIAHSFMTVRGVELEKVSENWRHYVLSEAVAEGRMSDWLVVLLFVGVCQRCGLDVWGSVADQYVWAMLMEGRKPVLFFNLYAGDLVCDRKMAHFLVEELYPELGLELYTLLKPVDNLTLTSNYLRVVGDLLYQAGRKGEACMLGELSGQLQL